MGLGKTHNLVELLTTQTLKCDPDYTLVFVRCQKLKRLETTGCILKAHHINHCVKY